MVPPECNVLDPARRLTSARPVGARLERVEPRYLSEAPEPEPQPEMEPATEVDSSSIRRNIRELLTPPSDKYTADRMAGQQAEVECKDGTAAASNEVRSSLRLAAERMRETVAKARDAIVAEEESLMKPSMPERSSPSSCSASVGSIDSRRACPSCGRRFNPQSFDRHQRVCQQVFRNVRPQFDPMKGSAVYTKVSQTRITPTSGGSLDGMRVVTRAATAGALPAAASSIGVPSTPLMAARGVSDASKPSPPRAGYTLEQRMSAGASAVVVTTLRDEAPLPAAPATVLPPPSAAAAVLRPTPAASAVATAAASAVAAAAVAAAATCRDPTPSSTEKAPGPAVALGTPGSSAVLPAGSDRLAASLRSSGGEAAVNTSGIADSFEEQEQRVKNMMQQQMQELHEMRQRHSRKQEAGAPLLPSGETEHEVPGSPLFDTQSDEVINTFLATTAAGAATAKSIEEATRDSATEEKVGEQCSEATQPESRPAGLRAALDALPKPVEAPIDAVEFPIGSAPASMELPQPISVSQTEVPAAQDVEASPSSPSNRASCGEAAAQMHEERAGVAAAKPQEDEAPRQGQIDAKSGAISGDTGIVEGSPCSSTTANIQDEVGAPSLERLPQDAGAPLDADVSVNFEDEPPAIQVTSPKMRVLPPRSLQPSSPDASQPSSPKPHSLPPPPAAPPPALPVMQQSPPVYEGTGAAAGSRAPRVMPSEAEASQSSMAGLKVCEDCGRRFNPASFEKHRAVCRSVFGGKSNRTPFESSSQRLRSLPVRQSETPPRPGKWELAAQRESQQAAARAFSPPKRSVTSSEGPTRDTSPTGASTAQHAEVSALDSSCSSVTAAVAKSVAAANAAVNSVSRKISSTKINRTGSASSATTCMPCTVVRTTSTSGELDDLSPASATGGAEGGASPGPALSASPGPALGASPGPGPARLTSPTRPLQTCPFCNRSFRPAAFEKHTKVCQSVFPTYDGRSEQRYVYDSRRHRLKGTPFEAYTGTRSDRKASVSPSPCDRATSSTPPQPPRVTLSSQQTAAQHTTYGRGSSRSPKTQLRRSVSESTIPAKERSNSVPAAPRSEHYPLAKLPTPLTASAEGRIDKHAEPLQQMLEISAEEPVEVQVATISLTTPLMEASADDDSNGTAPADAAAGTAPRTGEAPAGANRFGMAGKVLTAKEMRRKASVSPRQRDTAARVLYQDRRGLLERARFGMKMSQRTEYTTLLGGSVSHGSLRDEPTPGKEPMRTSSVRTRRRNQAPPPRAGGSAGTGTAGPGPELLHLSEHDLTLDVDHLSQTEPSLDTPSKQEYVMTGAVSPIQQGPVLSQAVQGCGDAGSGGSDFDRRRTSTSGNGVRRGRSTEDFRSYYERALEHLGAIGTVSVPLASESPEGIGIAASGNISAEAAAVAAATRSAPVVPVTPTPTMAVAPSAMPRQGMRGIAREDLAVTEGKPGVAREDTAATEGKRGLAREDPADEPRMLIRGASGDLPPARSDLLRSNAAGTRNYIMPFSASPAEAAAPGAVRARVRQQRDDTPQSRTPRGSGSGHTLASHKYQPQSPGPPTPANKVLPMQQLPSPRRKSENPMLRRETSSTVRLRPGAASPASIGSISSTTQAPGSSSLLGSTSTGTMRTAPSVVASVNNSQQHLQHSASTGSAAAPSAPPTSMATVLTAGKLQGGEPLSGHAPPGVPAPLLQSMPNSISSGSLLAARNGVPRLDFRKVSQPTTDRHRTTQSSLASSTASTPVIAATSSATSTQAGAVQPAGQVVSQTSTTAAVQSVQKQAVAMRQSL